MKYNFFRLAFLVAAGCLLFWPETARAEETSLENSYYTLSNQERYTLIHEVKLNNFGSESAYGIDLRLPLMDTETPAYSRKLREQIEPWPDRFETDERGRRVAYYHLDELPAGAAMVFTQKYVVDVASIAYDKSMISTSDGYEGQSASYYLLPSSGIESDHTEIIEFARKAAGNKTSTYDVAKNAFAAVNLYMSYEHDDLVYGGPDRGALRALRRAQGVCEDYSSLYVAVLRALGIAARQQGGYLYLPNEHQGPPYEDEENERLNMNQMRHTWVEFFIPGQGWVIADPTFTYSFDVGGVLTKFPNWNYFASVTNERRYLFFREGSVNEDQGGLSVENLPNGAFVRVGGSQSTNIINGYLLSGSQAAYYNDLPGHWSEEAIMRLSEREEPLMQGLGNGMFGVDQPMTRAQMVACLQRILKSPVAGPKFIDLPATHWAYRDIGAAQQAGWISGYPDGTFRPDRAVTRAELAQLLVDVFQLQQGFEEESAEEAEEPTAEGAEEPAAEDVLAPEEGEGMLPDTEAEEAKEPAPAFKDLGMPGYAWADEAISILAELGLTQGNGDGYYQPQRAVTRAEFATFLDRIMIMMEQ